MSIQADPAEAPTPNLPAWTGVRGLVVLLAIAVASVFGFAPTSPRPAAVPAAGFSSARALSHIAEVADAPRPVGSVEHAQAREYLLNRLDSWGWKTEVQRAVGTTDVGVGTQPVAAVANVIAKLPGTSPTGTVLLAAHYDTVAGAPGAGDDGIGVGTLLETARAVSTDDGGPDEAPRNDVMLLFSDAEEPGLLGAEAFVRERAAALGTTVVLNHEARGTRGAPTTFRTTSPNGTLLGVLSVAPGASAESAAEAVFAALPNNSDFAHFSDAGMHGYDTAITAGGAFYHSPLDDPERLSAASLQQMGETTLALTRELADLDLATVTSGGNDIVTTLPWGLLRYPESWEIPVAVGTLVLVGVLVGLRRSRGALTLPRCAVSAVVALVTIAAAGAAGYAVWQAELLVDPGQASAVVGEPYRPHAYQVAVLLAALGVVLACYGLVRRPLGEDALAVGSLSALALAGALIAVTVPGVSGSLVLPTLFAAAGAVMSALLPERWTTARGIAVVIALVPVAVLLGPGVWTGFDIGVGLGGPVSAALLGVCVLLALPVIGTAWAGPGGSRARGRWRTAAVPASVLVLSAAATATGLFVNRQGATPPRQEMVWYSVDADTGQARWVARVESRTQWSRSLLSQPPAALDDAFPWEAGQPMPYGPAPAADLAPPRVEVVSDVMRDGARELTLRLSSMRGAPGVGLWVDATGATVREARVAGRDLPTNGTRGKWNFGFLYQGATADGVDVRLLLDQRTSHVTIRVADRSHDLSVVPLPPPPRDRVLVTPQVVTTRTVVL